MRLTCSFLLLVSVHLPAQVNTQPDAAHIKLAMKKLNFLGSVLYVAAHPDDENTRAIAYMANERLATTGYLSMTRGDGGQNLIGPEIREQLGVIRTQELLAARRIDGGLQFFTRAVDFGYSKNAEETFSVWNKEEVLSDVVRIFRQFQPDIVLNRFPPDARAGHGHHTASGMLSQEAFELAGNPKAYPDQIKELGVWQPHSLYTNTGRWWNKDIDKNTPGIVAADIGSYNTLLGKSYGEIAAESRTQHKSQGFGSAGSRGEALEFFEFEKGYHAKGDLFETVNTTWSRVPGGERVEPLILQLIKDFNEEKPAASVSQLLVVRKEMMTLKDGIWKRRKLEEVNRLIQDCLGLYVQAAAARYAVAPGELIPYTIELTNRSSEGVKLTKIQGVGISFDSTFSLPLTGNKTVELRLKNQVATSADYSGPYWLKSKHALGLFSVSDKNLIGKPQNDPAIAYSLQFELRRETFHVQVPLIYKWTDPVKGELWRPLEIVPPVSVNMADEVLIFNDENEKVVAISLKSNSDQLQSGKIVLEVPPGWRVSPASHDFQLVKRNEERTISFNVFPSSEEINSSIKALATIEDKTYDQSMQLIQYDHIPVQTLLKESKVKLVRINLKTKGERIGYIQGAGDDIPSALRNMGYNVWEMKNEEVNKANLSELDAVVLGIRALNTNERAQFFMKDLLEYVQDGGTLVVQYNTSSGLLVDKDKFSPYPLSLSRERVTDESSKVRFINSNHAVLNFPNKIYLKDFEGWVQERGLYFPDKWDTHFDSIVAMQDPGEKEMEGALLVAPYGKGHYIYTGISFFRELPEGVPGAYKLFANLVSLGYSKRAQEQKINPGK